MLSWLTLLACSGSSELPPPDTGDGAALSACEPALSLAAEPGVVDAWGFVQLQGSGGTGDYRYSLQGVGEVSAETGAFLAGDSPGTATLTLADVGCLGAASAEIQVVDGLSLSPESASLSPGQILRFQVSGGAAPACVLVENQSGASLDAACVYTAGPDPGVDQVRLEDPDTGTFAAAVLTVSDSAQFSVWGHEHVYLPQGARFDFAPVGGSGAVSVSVRSGDVLLEGNTVTGGEGLVRVADRYIETWVDVQIHALSPIVPEAERDGERSGLGSALHVGDVDGDGYEDAILGTPEVSSGAYYGGQVSLYAGSPEGLSPTPVRTWAGGSRYEALGKSLAQGDIDGDGLPELLIGSGGIDRGATNNGGVQIYAGVEGGFWDSDPTQVLYGVAEYDRFGDAMALCDFDGDGWTDLAVGAPDSQDASAGTQEQGSVQVFKGGASGFADRPDFVLWGQVPEGADWVATDNAHFGESVAATDLNEDGLCDLAAGGTGEDAVLVWAGTRDEGLVLERLPKLVLQGAAGDFGRSLAAAPVGGDRRGALLVGHWDADIEKSNGGAAFLFADLDLDQVGEILHSDEAAWTVYGDGSSDYVGSSVAMQDLDGDGRAEVLIGAYRMEDDSRTNQGVVLYYRAISVRTDGTKEDTTRNSERLLGPKAYGRFGQALAPVDDQGALVLAGYDSSWGVEAGAPWYAPLDGSEMSLLELPGEASGHAFGQAMALVDVNGDGDAQLVFGAPGAGEVNEGANAGRLYAYALDQRVLSDPQEILGGHHSWSASDGYGHGLALGDFDGDGRQDLAVAARKDSKLSSLDSSYANPSECAEYVALAGAVLIYRGRGAGFASDPTWIVHAPDSYGYIDTLESGFDLDGDGRDELAFGGEGWHAGGGFGIAFGRPRDSGGITVICDAMDFEGASSFDRLGYSFAGVQDLDGDGCDELAVGATGTEYSSDYYNQGMVHLIWGGSQRCGQDLGYSALSLRTVGAGIGASLDAADVDGDGRDDLLIGGAERRADFAELGGVWVSPGHHLVQATRHALGATLPDLDSLGFEYLIPDEGLEGLHGLFGPSAASRFGESVAWVSLPDGGWAAAVGMPQGGLGGTDLSGGVALFHYSRTDGHWGLDPTPFAVVAGESFGPLGELGSTLRAQVVDGESYLLVGAPLSDAGGMDLGAGYLVSLD